MRSQERFFRAYDKPAPGAERADNVARENVKREAGHLKVTVRGIAQLIRVLPRVVSVDYAAVIDHHAFRPARGAGGIDYIGEVLRYGAARRVLLAFPVDQAAVRICAYD